MDERAALVTGSSKGIGAAIAKRLAREGYHAFVTYYRDEPAGRRVVADIESAGGRATLLHLDVRSQDSVLGVMHTIEQRVDHLNVLVNNAVMEIAKNIEDASFEEWKIVTETKIDGAFLCTKHAVPLLRKADNPNVIIITSYDGVKPQPDYIAYCIGTAGLIAFTKAMAVYLPRYGIRVNAVSPGTTRTPLWDALGGDNEQMWARFAERNPMGRIPTVEDVAEAVVMIVNDSTRYLNGNFVYVNGGAHLGP